MAVSWQGPGVRLRKLIIKAEYVDTFALPPLQAFSPVPANGAVDAPQAGALSWKAGEKAVTHDVYFGEDEAAVAAATPADAGIYKGSLALENNSWSPGALEWGKTYYWRIDEVNDAAGTESPWKGSVWSFSTANFLVVDDFESYTDEVTGRIFQTWIDGWGYTEPAPQVGYTTKPPSRSGRSCTGARRPCR